MTADIGDEITIKSLTSETFTREIEKLVNTYDLEYMDAVVHFCEKNNIEIETAASIIKSNLKIKSKLQIEAEGLNMLTFKSAKLPF